MRTALLGAAPILAATCVAFWSAAAIAAVDDRGVCGSVPPKPGTFAACTRIIASPGTSAHDRAMALAFRGDATRAHGDMASAVADYAQALTLLPDYLPALIGRGMAYREMGDTAHAVADFDQAIKLNPQNAKALYQRGVAKRGSGDASGDADIAAAKALNPDIANQP